MVRDTPRHDPVRGVAAAIGRAMVPLAVAANIISFLLSLWILEHTRPGPGPELDAWRLVTVIVLIGVQGLWLVWRRRQALGTVTASLLLWIAAILVGGYEPLAVQPGVLLAVFTYAAERTGWRRSVLLACGGVVTAGALLLARALTASPERAPWQHPAEIVLCVLLAGATVGLPALAGGWFAQLRDHAERIADIAERATMGEATRTTTAVAAERRALAQELHDTSSGHLTAILALSAAARATTTSEHGIRFIDQVSTEGRALFEGFERMLNSLRQEDRTITGTHQPGSRAGQHNASELATLVAEHRRSTRSAVAFRHDPSLAEIDQRLGPMRSHTAYRVVQEALNNARKHAPGSPLAITLEDDGESLLLRIENETVPDTAGNAASASPGEIGVKALSLGYGLEGVRDRLTAVGGSLRTGPTQRGGWSVNALLPHPPHQRTRRLIIRQLRRDRVAS